MKTYIEKLRDCSLEQLLALRLKNKHEIEIAQRDFETLNKVIKVREDSYAQHR
jgi:hypothetical protein